MRVLYLLTVVLLYLHSSGCNGLGLEVTVTSWIGDKVGTCKNISANVADA